MQHRGLADQRDQHLAVGHPRLVGGEARVVGPFRVVCQLGELAELAVVADREDHVAVGGGEVLVRHDVRVCVAQAPRRHAGGQVVEGLVGQAGDLHVEQGHIDVLADAADVAVGEGGEHRGGGVQPGEDIGQRHADLHRTGAFLVVGAPGEAHQAAQALDHEVIAGALGIGAGLAEAGDRTVDQLRVDLLQRFIVEAIGLEPADLEVLQQDVGLGRQFANDALAFRLGEVHRHRLLVAVGRQVVGRLAGVVAFGILEERRAPGAGVVAAAGALDLDHLGAEVGEDLPGPGAGQDTGQVEYADMGKGAGHDGSRCWGLETEMAGKTGSLPVSPAAGALP